MARMQKVVCTKSAPVGQEQFGIRGFMYYIDLDSLSGSYGEWYADLYSLKFTKLGSVEIYRFSSMCLNKRGSKL